MKTNDKFIKQNGGQSQKQENTKTLTDNTNVLFDWTQTKS